MAKFFVSGTDTGVGKTIVTGMLARNMLQEGKSVITQKLIQTGCEGISEDIIEHRKIMGVPLFEEDRNFTTCRYVAKFPASPHLAFEMEGIEPDYGAIAADTEFLEKKFGTVIVEGAGGLMVPLKKGFLTADYVADRGLELVLVVPSRLGSLNHALLSLEYCIQRGINLRAIVYNTYPEAPKQIEVSTLEYLEGYLADKFSGAEIIRMGKV